MLLSVRADRESFKKVTFSTGFNVILAERTKESTKRDSRNGLGKTSLIQIIHFCLGGKLSKTLSNEKLADWTFTLDIEILEKKFAISRNTSDKRNVFIEGDCTDWPIKPEIDKKTGKQIMRLKDWRDSLGVLLLSMQVTFAEKYVPTFRSCISYFARQNGEKGGFLEPFSQYRNQQEWDRQVNNCYLLGLDWTHASKWQVLKDRKKVLDQLKREAESGILEYLQGNIGELEARKVRLEEDIRKQKSELDSFRVHEQYDRIEKEANQLTFKIHELANDNVSDRRLLDYYEGSLETEKDASLESVEAMYKQAGVVMPENVTKRLDEVNQFHQQIVVNRKEFLQSEIIRLKQALTQRENEIRNLSERRAELLGILRTHGALDEYTKLQQRNASMISDLKSVTNRLESLKKFEQGKSALKVDLELLQQQAWISLDERSKIKEEAIALFNSNSQYLYESPGELSINVTRNGYAFKVDIQREGSHGISNMKIFCYDLVLAQLWAKKKVSPRFLIHDSILFADVDERQTALALELAARETEKRGFQYICTMNSDGVPYGDFSKEFDFSRHVILKLTDKTEDGSLFGMRF